MTNFLIKLKNLSIITIIASIIIGAVLVIKPDQALQFVSLILGVTIILLGVGAWISYFTKSNSVFMASLGTISLIAGIVICVRYKAIISIMLFMFGIFLIISGVIDFISALDAKKNNIRSWILSLIMSVAIVIFGVIIVVNPFSSMVFVVRFLGVGLIVYAVMDLISFVQISKISKLNTINDNNIVEIQIDKDDIE